MILEQQWLNDWALRNQRSELMSGDFAEVLEVGNENGLKFDSQYVIDTNQQDLPENLDLNDSDLIDSPGFQRASEILYKGLNPQHYEKKPVEGPVGTIGTESYKKLSNKIMSMDKGGLTKIPQNENEFAHWGVEFQGSLEYNLPKAAINYVQLGKLAKDNPLLAVASLALQEEYAKLGVSWNGTRRFISGMATDPTTYVGLGTLGYGFIGRQGAKQVTKKGFTQFLKKALDPRLLAVYESGGYVAAEDYIRQQKEIRSNEADPRTGKSEFDKTQSLISAGIGFAGGSAIIGGIEGVKKAAPYIAEGIRNLGKDADKRINARNADGGFTLNSGVDPIPAVDSLISSAGKALTDKRVGQDELGFYSNALEQAKNLKQDSGQGSQLRGILVNNGVKEDEIKWTGLDEILSKPKVTKDEIVKHLEDNRVELKEVTLEPDPDGGIDRLSWDEGRVDDDSENWLYRTEDYIYDLQNNQADDYLLEPIFKGLREQDATEADIKYIQQKIADNDYDSLPSDTKQNIENILDGVAYEDYMQNPYKVWSEGNAGYSIFGNDDVGYTVKGPQGDNISSGEVYSFDEARVQVESHAMDYGYLGGEGEGATRWMEYKQPGGDNYREILLANPGFKGDPDLLKFDLPNVEVQEIYNLNRKKQFAKTLTPDMAQQEFTPAMRDRLQLLLDKDKSLDKTVRDNNLQRLEKFNSSHFDQDNIVAHVRVTDREGFGPGGNLMDGKSILYAEEIQSDWAQRGRIKGFYNPPSRPRDVIVNESDDLVQEIRKKLSLLNDDQLNEIRIVDYNKLFNKTSNMPITPPNRFFEKGDNEDRYIDDVTRILIKGSDDNPTIIETPIEFFKQFDTIKNIIPLVEKRRKNIKEISGLTGETKGPFVDTSTKWSQLALKRLVRQATEKGYDYVAWTPGKVQLDRWGEQGLIDFYDKVLPKAAKDVLKKLDKDAKLQVIKVNIDGEMQDTLAIQITDTIKNQAPQGQPLFTPIAATIGAGTMAKQQMDNESNK